MAVLFSGSAAMADWHRSYAVEWQEPAFYNGDSQGETDPGTDCPLGANADNDWRKMMRTPWREDVDVQAIMNPENPSRQRDGGYRGPSEDISVYYQPWTVPDPGLFEVVGEKSYGFNLDGDDSNGFTGVDGTPGVDNEYYRIHGCNMWFRGPHRMGNMSRYGNDRMHEGRFTILMVISGEGDDPMNDENAVMGFYLSPDPLVKDQNGAITSDYTYRLEPDESDQHLVNVRVENGVVTATEPQTIKIRGMELYEGQLHFEMLENGMLDGFAGGYRHIDTVYDELNGGGTLEIITHTNIPAMWYALQRRADAHPDEDGNNTWISAAYRYTARPAHIVTPDAEALVTAARIYPGEVATSMASGAGGN